MPNPYRYMIARDGGVLWKWDGIVQLAISDRPSKTATKLD